MGLFALTRESAPSLSRSSMISLITVKGVWRILSGFLQIVLFFFLPFTSSANSVFPFFFVIYLSSFSDHCSYYIVTGSSTSVGGLRVCDSQPRICFILENTSPVNIEDGQINQQYYDTNEEKSDIE